MNRTPDPSAFDDAFDGGDPFGDVRPAGQDGELVRRIPEGVQGASESDLRAFPPDGEICAHFRELLRDRVDSDRYADELGDELKQRIDEHVHACRTCSLALARADYEVVRILRALARRRATLPKLGSHFTARVLESALESEPMSRRELEAEGLLDRDLSESGELDPELAEELAERDAITLAGSDVPFGPADRESADSAAEERVAPAPGLPAASFDFTDRVMAAVRDTLGDAARASAMHRVSRPRPKKLGFAAKALYAAATCCFGFAAAWLWYGSRSLGRSALPVRVQAAVAARSGERTLQRGDTLPAGSVVTTAASGSCALEIAAGEAGGTPTLLDLAADSALETGKLGCAPLRGEVLLRTSGDFVVKLGSAEATLDAGEYVVGATAIERVDQALSSRAFTRWRLECRHGRATLVRSSDGLPSLNGHTLVHPGSVASFDAWSPVVIEVDPATVLARLRAADRGVLVGLRTGEPGVVVPATFVGTVVDRASGKPVAGAQVAVRLANLEHRLTSDERGEFRVSGPGALDGAFAVVEIVPPRSTSVGGSQGAFAAFGPLPVRLEGIGPAAAPGEQRLREFALSEGRVARGRVRDAEGRWLAGAVLQAYRHDELVGALVAIPGANGRSDAAGAFALAGLPPELPAHTACVVLAYTEQRAPVAVWPGLDGAACEIVLAQGQDARIVGLNPDQYVDVVEATPGLPLTALERRRHTRADLTGVARLAGVGRGPLWLQREPRGPWIELIAARDAEGLVLTLGTRALAPGLAAALDQRSREATVVGPGVRIARARDRFAERPVGGAAVPAGSARGVHVVDGEGGAMSLGTQIFVVSGDGARWIFLGEYDGRRPIPLRGEFEAGSRLVGIGRDGSISTATLDKLGEATTVDLTLQMRRTGSLELAPAVRPGVDSGRQRVLLNLRMLSGEFAGLSFSRFAEASADWVVEGVPAGEYEVVLEDGSVSVCAIDGARRPSIGAELRTNQPALRQGSEVRTAPVVPEKR